MKTTDTKNGRNKDDSIQTNAITWLELDLCMQTGSIWIDQDKELNVDNSVYLNDVLSANILKPDPTFYNEKALPNDPQIID